VIAYTILVTAQLLTLWSERPKGHEQVVLVARRPSEVSGQVARIPRARSIGFGVVAVVVDAAAAAEMLNASYGEGRGQEVRGRDVERVVVVELSDDGAEIEYLDNLAAGVKTDLGVQKATGERAKTMKKTTVTQQAASIAPAPEKPARKTKKAKPKDRSERPPRPLAGLYGAQTSISVEETHRQIRALLNKYGCSVKRCGDDDETGESIVEFKHGDKLFRSCCPTPKREDYTHKIVDGCMWRNSEDMTEARFQRARMQRWRAICAGLRGRLIEVQSEIRSLMTVFMAEVVDPVTDLTISQLVERRAILPQLGPAAPSVLDAELEDELPRAAMNGARGAEARA
jgi:hypothetical protein